ncbi:MAG: efflux RND transporter periplasmic adaptor subunit [Pseudomonadota bacterium]
MDLPKVRVRQQTAQNYIQEVVVRGRSEAVRRVEVEAEIPGRIVEVLVDRGAWVEEGDVLARLSVDDRQARVNEALALAKQRDLAHEAVKKLNKKGFKAAVQVAETEAALAAARAAVKKAQVALANTVLRAPFAGVVESRVVEIGDYVEPGDDVAWIVDLNPMLMVGHVSEQQMGRLAVGAQGRARLVTGSAVEGTLRFISSVADQATRTFRIELQVDNPEGRIPDGVTAEIRLPLERLAAHLVSPAILTLDDAGRLGVKTLTEEGTVGFFPVKVLETGPDGVWLDGLPATVTFITVGQEFVKIGQKVRAVEEPAMAARDAAQ